MKNTNINKTFLIILLGILAALGPFTIDMYLPGFHDIAEDFDTDEQKVAFTLTSYFIGIAIGQLFYGPIMDKYGRKRPLIFGLLLYLISAVGCAYSISIEMLIGMRFIQALGGCVGMVAATAIITDVYEVDYRARAFSLIMLVMGVAPLIAPATGSLFLVHGHWSYIFYFLALFSGLIAALIYFFLPETAKYMHSNKLVPKRIILDYFEILKNRTFLYYTLAGSIAMSVLFAYISSASYIFLTYFELNKATFSVLFAINASGLISGTYINGWLTRKYNYIKIGNYATVVLVFISFVVLGVNSIFTELPYQWVVVGLFSILFTIGFINPNALAASMTPFTGNSGAASALGGAIRMGAGATVAGIIGLLSANNTFVMFLMIAILSVLTFFFFLILPKRWKKYTVKNS